MEKKLLHENAHWRTRRRGSAAVEEKFGKLILKSDFGYLARCEGQICTTTLKNETFVSKLDENAEPDSAKIWNFDFSKFEFPEKYEIGKSKFRKTPKSPPQNLKFDCHLQ